MWKHITVSSSAGSEDVKKTFKFKSVESLKDQLFSSFSLGAEGPIEVVDKSGHIVALGDLEDSAEYYLPASYSGVCPAIASTSCWSSNKLWQTKDPIHDMISLPDFCQKIIDTAEFQRLRDVKQLGACSFVYIGGAHSRFEHSIGTAQLAFKMASNLKVKQPELGITSIDVLCVTIAGLCHDLGHGPFSHVWDDQVLPRMGITDHRSHEENSIDLFDSMMSKLKESHTDPLEPALSGLTDKDLTFIKAMIHAPKIVESHGRDSEVVQTDPAETHSTNRPSLPYSEYSDRPSVQLTRVDSYAEFNGPSPMTSPISWDEAKMGRPASKRFLFEIVSNKRSGLDVDKFDYIQRDCHNTGVRGVYEIDRVVLNAEVHNCDGELQLCWPQKEVENLYEVYHTRESLHRRVYQHRVSKACEIMVRDAFVLAAPHMTVQNGKGDWLSFKDAQYDPTAFVHLSDWLVQLLLHGPHVRLDYEHPNVKKAQEILSDMHQRKIWKYVGSTTAEVEDERQVAKELAAFSGNKIKAHEWEVTKVVFSWGMGTKNPIENVRFISKHSSIPKKLKPEDASKMLPGVFKEQQLNVYVRKFSHAERDEATKAFQKWCNARGIEGSTNDSTGLNLTDCRKRRRRDVVVKDDGSPHHSTRVVAKSFSSLI